MQYKNKINKIQGFFLRIIANRSCEAPLKDRIHIAIKKTKKHANMIVKLEIQHHHKSHCLDDRHG